MDKIIAWWDALPGKTKGLIESFVIAVVTPVLDVLFQQFTAIMVGTSSTLNVGQLDHAALVGAAAGGVYLVAYLRGLLMLPSGQNITEGPSVPVSAPAVSVAPASVPPAAPAASEGGTKA